ncbi:AAA domain-containing protein [Terribacillus aidingensis]|uniref:AAA domain-containing protein n=1 Tax=Terribacillus aidingensis TaxID=586416 RepID=A0A285MZQ0_9BACI|nr:AAA family ATPase [Terribacillus aidingensis]SNZ02685.1 AAA domain-containing protein [Terribacillus aidingensis]
MIIWLNGAFGAGKTQTAITLQYRLPHAFLYDPEQAGLYIRKNLPNSMQKADFQNHPLWRSIVREHLAYLTTNTEGIILVPMTITDSSNYEEIIGQLRKDGHEVLHFVLAASAETLGKRLAKRGNKENSWAAQQIPRCMNGLANPLFENKLVTDELAVDEVAAAIAERAGLNLHKDCRPWWKVRWMQMTSRWR